MRESDNSNPLSERERQILAYRKEGHSYREVCRDLHVSPSEISAAEKKERGEYNRRSSEKESTGFGKYSEIYSLFSQGKKPLQVAIALNLPLDYISREYISYLRARRLYRVVQFYQEKGDEGLRVILYVYESLKRFGHGSDPDSVGRYVSYCERVYSEGKDLEQLRRERDRLYTENWKAKRTLSDLNKQIAKSKLLTKLEDIDREVEEKNIELARISDTILFCSRTDPAVVAAQAAREAAERVLSERINTSL